MGHLIKSVGKVAPYGAASDNDRRLPVSKVITAGLLCVPLVLVGCKKTTDTQNSTPSATTDTATATAASTVTHSEPVVYPFETWQTTPAPKPMGIDDIERINQQLGKVLRTDPKSLDYASNIATKYSFAGETAPYLDTIDSPSYLELGWYYANPTDSDNEKNISQDYAAKANQLARAWFGEQAGNTLIKEMLTGSIIQNRTLNGKVIELAKCEFYSCMLIIKK